MKKRSICVVLSVIAVMYLFVGCNVDDVKSEIVSITSSNPTSSSLTSSVPTDEDIYNEAIQNIENGDFSAALELLTRIESYADSKDKIALCQREIGMTEKADYAFLSDIEQSILNRMEKSTDGDSDYSKLVNTELAYLDKYTNADFYDDTLKQLAAKYVEGLNLQKEALTFESESEYQLAWQRGLVYREEVMLELYTNYDFLSDNADFIGTYIAEVENEQWLLKAYEDIEADIGSQITDDSVWTIEDGNNVCGTLKNNTEYTISTIFEFRFYDADEVMYESNETYIENIKPGTGYTVSVPISNPDRCNRFEFKNYYTDVKGTNVKGAGTNTTTESAVKTAYEKARSLTIADLEKKTERYYYKGLIIQSEDEDWLLESWNTEKSLNQGALYRTIANYLEGFTIGLNNGSDYCDIMCGIEWTSKADFTPYANNAMDFICTEDSLNHIMKKLESLASVQGEFDFDYGELGKFSVDIPDLSACAEEMQISEEMLGYILSMLDEYAANISFEGNSCHISYESYKG